MTADFWIILGDFIFHIDNGMLCVLIGIAFMLEKKKKKIPIMPPELAV